MEKQISYLPVMGLINSRLKHYEAELRKEFGFKISLKAEGTGFEIAIDSIAKLVSDCLGTPMNLMLDKRGKQPIVDAKKIAMYLCKKYITKVTVESIGEYFGMKDHSSVLHNINSINDLIDVGDKATTEALILCEYEIKKRM